MRSLSIKTTIPLLIVTPILASVAITGWVSYQNGRKAVEQLAMEVNSEATQTIEEHATKFLQKPQIQLQVNVANLQNHLETLDDFGKLQAIFWDITHQVDTVRNFYYGTTEGHFLSVTAPPEGDFTLRIRDESTAPGREIYELDTTGQIGKLLQTTDYDPRARPWYQIATAQQNRGTVWSSVYTFANPPNLGITAAKPLYNQSNELLGVFAIDLYLSEIGAFLRKLKLSPRGVSFIMERDGALVATSTEQPTQREIEGKVERVNIFESDDVRLKDLAIAILEKFEQDLGKIATEEQFAATIDGKTYYIGVTPLEDERGIDWLLVVSIPELDFQDLISATTRSTIFIGIAIAILGTLGGLFAARWIVEPINSLNAAARAIEADRFEPMTLNRIVSRSDEVGELARIFQNMGIAISANQTSLKEQMQDLEGKVAAAKRQTTRGKRYDIGTIQDLLERSRQTRSQSTFPETPESLPLETFLPRVPAFANFSAEEIQALIPFGQQQTFSAAREILPTQTLYLLLSGRVEIRPQDSPQSILSSGDMFGQESLLLDAPSPSTLRTLVPSQLFTLERPALKKFLEQYPGAIDKIVVQLTRDRDKLLSLQALFVSEEARENRDPDSNLSEWVRDRLLSLFDLSREKI